MPRKNFRRRQARGRKVKLPDVKQPAWKKMVGISTKVADKIARLKGPIGVVGKVLSGIGNMINVETKWSDTSISLEPTTTGIVTLLTGIAQGATDVTRNGNSILSKSIDVKLTVNQHVSTSYTICRMMLIIDKENAQGTAPTLAQLLQNVTPQDFLNQDNTDRFVVLYSSLFIMRTGTNSSVRTIEFHKNLSDLHIRYDGTAATQANATQNHLYLILLSSEDTNKPIFSGKIRYKFMDN